MVTPPFLAIVDSDGQCNIASSASATVVLPWMMSSTSALLRFAAQRLMSSSIFVFIVNFLDYDVSRFSLGQDNFILMPLQMSQAKTLL